MGRTPKRGDAVFVPDGHGTWVNGICNAVNEKGEMLVGMAPGAHKSGALAMLVQVEKRGEHWAWPGEMPGMVNN